MDKGKKRRLLVLILLVVFVGVVYRGWFRITPLSAGDWGFHFPEEIARFITIPSSWMYWFHGGLGANGVFVSGLESFYLNSARAFYELTGGSWMLYERIIWFIPFLLISIYASITLVRTVLSDSKFWWISTVIFLTNTYILMITGGGQMGVAMAYACAPLVFANFIRLYQFITSDSSIRKIYRQVMISGLALSLMILFDQRIAAVLVSGVIIYWIVSIIIARNLSVRLAFFFGMPFLIAALLHAFWILPFAVFHINPTESLGGDSSTASIKFFSFADFSHTLALLHPNWPENLFGKVYFLQPEFLLIPLMAWGVFIGKTRKQYLQSLICFGFVGLLGIFFAKGANEPGSGLYLWLYTRVPGFSLFRDPTKFYLLIALAYSILIPATLDKIGKKLPAVIFIFIWIFTIRQAIAGQLSGTFAPHIVPHEYEALKDIINQQNYFRTFWLPHVQRYGLSSYMHPAIDAGTILDTGSPSAMLAWISSASGAATLANWSVKYVVLPYDSQGELFLADRKYSEVERSKFQEALDANPYLTKKTFKGLSDSISVYETKSYEDHVWIKGANPEAKLHWEMKNPTLYTFEIERLHKPAQLVLTESFDQYWQMHVNGRVVTSRKMNTLNSFSLSAGDSKGTLEYLPQRYVWYGLGISGLGLIIVFALLVIL